MAVFEKLKDKKHEQLIFFREPVSGLRAIVAIHDTTLGPAIGGVRMRTYSGEDEAIEDALAAAAMLGEEGFGTVITYLGENVTVEAEAGP